MFKKVLSGGWSDMVAKKIDCEYVGDTKKSFVLYDGPNRSMDKKPCFLVHENQEYRVFTSGAGRTSDGWEPIPKADIDFE